jgi:ribose/xylose/arabinose/galactoside ABC-type transport system permease subunit
MNDKELSTTAQIPVHFYENTAWRLGASLIWIGLVLVLTVVVIIWAVSSQQFNMKFIATNLLTIGLMVPAMVMIVSAGGLDLSVGSVIALVGVVVATLMQDLPPVVAVVLGLGLALVIGLINGTLVGLARIPGVLVTLAMLALARGLAVVMSEGRPMPLEGNAQALDFLPVAGWILFVIVGLGSVLLVQLTPFGRRPDPCQSEQAEAWLARALFVGVPYILSSLMAGFAGILLLQRLRASMPTVGTNMELNVILAVIIGGTCLGGRFGTVIGGLLGAVFVSFLQYLLVVVNASPYLQQLIIGALLLVGGGLCYGYYTLVGLVYRGRLKTKADSLG